MHRPTPFSSYTGLAVPHQSIDQTMATFNNVALPVEVISIIIDYTPQEDLVAVARVCKTLNCVVSLRI